jgi:hypothetical protein
MTKICLRFLFLGALALPLAHGCSDSPLQCLGSPVACGNRDLSQCTAGCSVREGCFGDVVTCESLTENPTLCLQLGCRYGGSCEGGPGCADTNYDLCATTAGCVQVAQCFGDDVRCSRLEDSQCELYPQCSLGRECVGDATPCGDLGSTSACLDVPGCLPADTTPSVVD